MANCPLRTSDDIEVAVETFKKNNRDFQISCFKFGWMNSWWSFKLNNDSSHEFMFPDAIFKRSQDLSDLYCANGSIWIAKSEKLKLSETFYGKGYKFEPIN